MQSAHEDLYTQEQLAEMLGVSVDTVSRRIKDFNLAPVVAEQYSMAQCLLLQGQLKIQEHKIADANAEENELATAISWLGDLLLKE